MITIVSYRPLAIDYDVNAPFANTKSLLFDGMDDYVDCGVISAFQSTANFSISCWLKVPDFSAPNNFFFGTFTSGSNTIYASVTNTQRLLFNFNNGYNAFSLPSIVAGQWHNVIFVFDGAINQLVTYIDGVGTTGLSAPSSTGTSTGDTSIGFVPFGNYFNGNIDEFAIYDYSLTQQNATDIYNLGTPNDLSLLATPPTNWYRMGDLVTAFPIIPDVIGTNDGTAFNEPESTMIVSDVP